MSQAGSSADLPQVSGAQLERELDRDYGRALARFRFWAKLCQREGCWIAQVHIEGNDVVLRLEHQTAGDTKRLAQDRRASIEEFARRAAYTEPHDITAKENRAYKEITGAAEVAKAAGEPEVEVPPAPLSGELPPNTQKIPIGPNVTRHTLKFE